MEATTTHGGKLGRKPRRADPRDLHFARFARPLKTLPAVYNFWQRRKAFPLRTWGNTEIGDCTRASQAAAALRMERIETSQTANITDDEVERVYFAMTERLYGGGDTGAFEDDALSEWRKAETTFRSSTGHPYTIDAYLRVDAADLDAVKQAIVTSGAHGIKVCANLPLAWADVTPPSAWSIPDGQPLTGDWEPGSWGGHSLFLRSYDQDGVWLVHTWGIPDQRVTWQAFAAYFDEAHVVIDSMDAWRKRAPKALDYAGIKRAVNAVSSTKIA